MKPLRTHYLNLKIERTATKAEIRKAYRRLASANHPDRNGNSESSIRNMQIINRAYEVLSDDVQRRAHDAWIKRHEDEAKNKIDAELKRHQFEDILTKKHPSFSDNSKRAKKTYDDLFSEKKTKEEILDNYLKKRNRQRYKENPYDKAWDRDWRDSGCNFEKSPDFENASADKKITKYQFLKKAIKGFFWKSPEFITSVFCIFIILGISLALILL